MSDGITDMYHDIETCRKNEDFFGMFALYLLQNKKADKHLIEMAMAAGREARILLGHFGWTGKEHEKSCKEKLDICLKKLHNMDVEEWTIFMTEFLKTKGSWDNAWKKLIDISPFKGCELMSVFRGNGTINIGGGIGPTLWDKAKKDMGTKWEKWDGYGLAVLKVEDIKVLALPKNRDERY